MSKKDKGMIRSIIDKIVYGFGLMFVITIFLIIIFGDGEEDNNNVAETSATTNNISELENNIVELEDAELEEEEPEEEIVEAILEKIILNETISTEYLEYTFTNIELSYEVLPSDTSGFYTKYTPDAGNVYIDVAISVKNTAKSNISCDDVISMKADYNDGYTYKGFTAVEDGSTGFTYSSITSIKPLETRELRYLIKCPVEVEETDNPLFLTTKLGDTDYIYTIR